MTGNVATLPTEDFPPTNPAMERVIEVLGTTEPPVANQRSPSNRVGVCYWNVEEFAKEHGGYRLDGWMIEWIPTLFVRAIHHAVWAHEDGRRIDVTDPGRVTGSSNRTTFIPDQRKDIDLSWPVNISNQYVKLVEDADLDQLVEAELETNTTIRKLYLELRISGTYSWNRQSFSPPVPEELRARIRHASLVGSARVNSASERLRDRYFTKRSRSERLKP